MVFSGEQNPNRGQQLAMKSAPVLQLEHLVVAYPGSADPTLDGLTLSLQRGERLALVGPSGCGKSTVARAVLGLLPEGSRSQGRLELMGSDPRRLRRGALLAGVLLAHCAGLSHAGTPNSWSTVALSGDVPGELSGELYGHGTAEAGGLVYVFGGAIAPFNWNHHLTEICLLYTSPSPRDA